eukprot:TRINITY_DN8382_c0_g3_i1.p1 TRINITY_DN8382_c0_g3~~TRINITY_DN8382_c0_g3_i1.p1  ORF type:complete len:585 (-),score=78.44 TRINITY_DN8382_c0_g3_i1:153-1907(-)
MGDARASRTQSADIGGLYEALGVRPDASADELKKAYRECAKRWHPDKTAQLEDHDRIAADAKFEAAKKAFDILSDPQRRSRYDGTGAVDGGGTRHEVVAYLSDVFGDLAALDSFCGTLWLELLFSDEWHASADACTRKSDPDLPCDPETSDGPQEETNSSQVKHSSAMRTVPGIGSRLFRHLFASALYTLRPSPHDHETAKSTSDVKCLLRGQSKREHLLAQRFREVLFVQSTEYVSENDNVAMKERLLSLVSDAAGTCRPRGLRLLRAAAQGLLASSSWALLRPRVIHALRAQWALARAVGAAVWAVFGGSDDAASSHAMEAATRLSEADVLCTCYAAKSKMLRDLDSGLAGVAQQRLGYLVEALLNAADAADKRASQISAARTQYSAASGASASAQHRLKMPGGMLYLGSARPRDGNATNDSVPHGRGRLFFADGSCHDGIFDNGRADGRGRWFGGAGAQEGCVVEGVWKQNIRVGAFDVWDAKGVLWCEKYNASGKKIARKKVQAGDDETCDAVQASRPLAAVPCIRCGKRFHKRWGSVEWCRHHSAGAWQEDVGAWRCCGATEHDNPGCEVSAHEAAPDH